MNVVVLMGRLVRDPHYSEGKNERGDYKRASFYLAVNRVYSKETAYVHVTVFGKTAEVVRDYLCQGKQIAVSGEIATGSYTDKETGKKIYTTEVNANRIEFTGRKEDSPADRQHTQKDNPQNERSKISNGSKNNMETGGEIPPPAPEGYYEGFLYLTEEQMDELPFR